MQNIQNREFKKMQLFWISVSWLEVFFSISGICWYSAYVVIFSCCKFCDYFVEFKNLKVACFFGPTTNISYTKGFFCSFGYFCTRQSTKVKCKSLKSLNSRFEVFVQLEGIFQATLDLFMLILSLKIYKGQIIIL